MTAATQATATVATATAAKYLGQLCKHWGHKFVVEHDGPNGKVVFPTAVLRLAAGPALVLTLDVDDASTLDRMQDVVAEHLQRFAFREALQVDWRPAAGG